MPWTPGPDPFPSEDIKSVTNFEYLNELHFVRHAKAPPDTTDSLWQLAKDFKTRCTVKLNDGAEKSVTLTAPRGLFTDLSSVPDTLWSLVGPIGKHLEASVIHDYLYMAWTDYRDKALRRDWRFANEVMMAGMKKSRVSRKDRTLIAVAIKSEIAWNMFRKKPYTLQNRMNQWLANLAPGHQREE